MDTAFTLFGILFLVAFFGAIVGSFFTVQTAEVAIVQQLGKFSRVAGRPQLENAVHRKRRPPH